MLGKKDAMRQSPVWPRRILDSIIRAKRSPQQIWGKKNTATLLMTPHQIPVENTYVAKSLFKLVVFSVFFFPLGCWHYRSFAFLPLFSPFYTCCLVAKLVSSFKLLGENSFYSESTFFTFRHNLFSWLNSIIPGWKYFFLEKIFHQPAHYKLIPQRKPLPLPHLLLGVQPCIFCIGINTLGRRIWSPFFSSSISVCPVLSSGLWSSTANGSLTAHEQMLHVLLKYSPTSGLVVCFKMC